MVKFCFNLSSKINRSLNLCTVVGDCGAVVLEVDEVATAAAAPVVTAKFAASGHSVFNVGEFEKRGEPFANGDEYEVESEGEDVIDFADMS